VIADALRPGHESQFYPGETNLRSADVIVLNKVGAAEQGVVERMVAEMSQLNPDARQIQADLDVEADQPEAICGRRVLIVEDGPTLTHGGMDHGAGTVAARRWGAAELVDPRPFAQGTIADAFRTYDHLANVLPALGYSSEQLEELAATIDRSDAELVVDASPARLDQLIPISKPVVRIRYRFVQRSGPELSELVDAFLARK
jgi:predicted GTPase